jgi:hypothetical protein
MKAVVLAVLAVLQLSGRRTADTATIPWLHGFSSAAVTEGDAGEPADFTDEELTCPANAQPPLRLTADISPVAGRESILATFNGGIRITSSEGVELASSSGIPCTGTADALEVLAVGSIFHEKTLVLAFTTGGRREQQVWLGVYRIGLAGTIDALFAGVVETREDDIVRSGSVQFLPGALIYRPPGHGDSLWIFDPVVHTYTPRGPFDHEGEPHS